MLKLARIKTEEFEGLIGVFCGGEQGVETNANHAFGVNKYMKIISKELRDKKIITVQS